MAHPFDPYLPADPIMQHAWVDRLRWAITEPDILAAFRADCCPDWQPPQSGLDRLIDDATGHDRQIYEQFLAWFQANIWGPL